MPGKPEIIFTFPDCLGGVASFNYNIINHSRLIRNFHSKVILLNPAEDQRPSFQDKFMADEVTVFHFSYKENQYYVQKRLNDLLGSNEGAIVTDNLLTVGAANQFNNPKTIFYLLHDYYYVNQNIEAGDLVDVAIAHSSFFSDAVFASNPALFAERSFYIPYGVQQLPEMPQKSNSILNLVFVGRLEEPKGVLQLHDINKKLQAEQINVNWTIVGIGPLKKTLVQQWKNEPNVSFHEPASTSEVYRLLQEQDIFVFPTMFEGTPVSILECMSNAVVTVTNDLPGGIRDIVTSQTGYRCTFNDMDEFADRIARLHNDRQLLKQMQKNCFEIARKDFDIEKNADDYFAKFLQYSKFKRAEKHNHIKMSRLDKPIFPNAMVKRMRSLAGG